MELSLSLKYEQLLYLISQLPDNQLSMLRADIDKRFFNCNTLAYNTSEQKKSVQTRVDTSDYDLFGNYLGIASNIWKMDAQEFVNDLRDEERF